MNNGLIAALILVILLGFSLIAYKANMKVYRPNYVFRTGGGQSNNLSFSLLVIFLLILLVLNKGLGVKLSASLFGILFGALLIATVVSDKYYYHRKRELYDDILTTKDKTKKS